MHIMFASGHNPVAGLTEPQHFLKNTNSNFSSKGFQQFHTLLGLKDRLCGLVVRVPGYTTEMYCASCEVRTEFIYVM
jgi:hypothetical protein